MACVIDMYMAMNLSMVDVLEVRHGAKNRKHSLTSLGETGRPYSRAKDSF